MKPKDVARLLNIDLKETPLGWEGALKVTERKPKLQLAMRKRLDNVISLLTNRTSWTVVSRDQGLGKDILTSRHKTTGLLFRLEYYSIMNNGTKHYKLTVLKPEENMVPKRIKVGNAIYVLEKRAA